MATDMNDFNAIVIDALQRAGLEYTIDNRVECLAALAKEVVTWTEVEPNDRVRLSLDIAVEIVRLRVEKEMFGL